MIIASIRIDPIPGKRLAVLDILMSVQTMVRLKRGCMYCDIFKEHDDGEKILYIEKWQAEEDMYQHIRSNLYLRILNAIELSSKPPEVCFHEDSETAGIELIETIRIGSAVKQDL
jgi:quinol monooxygenase YgiN